MTPAPALARALLLMGLAWLALPGCTSYGYREHSVKSFAVGQSRDFLMEHFAPKLDGKGLRIRASARSNRDTLLEVAEILLQASDSRVVVPYWLLFEDGRLVRWGTSDQWQHSPARYELHFSPSAPYPYPW